MIDASIAEIGLILLLTLSLVGLGSLFSTQKTVQFSTGLAVHGVLYSALYLAKIKSDNLWIPCLVLLVIGLILLLKSETEQNFRTSKALFHLLGFVLAVWIISYFTPYYELAVDGKHYSSQMAVAFATPDWIQKNILDEHLKFLLDLNDRTRTGTSQLGYLWSMTGLSIDFKLINRLGLLFSMQAIVLVLNLSNNRSFLFRLALGGVLLYQIIGPGFAGQINQAMSVLLGLGMIHILQSKIPKNLMSTAVGIHTIAITLIYPEFCVFIPLYILTAWTLNGEEIKFTTHFWKLIKLGIPSTLVFILRIQDYFPYLKSQAEAKVGWNPVTDLDGNFFSFLSIALTGCYKKIFSEVFILAVAFALTKQAARPNRIPLALVFIFLTFIYIGPAGQNYFVFKFLSLMTPLTFLLIPFEQLNESFKKIALIAIFILVLNNFGKMLPPGQIELQNAGTNLPKWAKLVEALPNSLQATPYSETWKEAQVAWRRIDLDSKKP